MTECDAVNPTETAHCAECHRSFTSDKLALAHWVDANSEHRDPPIKGATVLWNRYGTPVWTQASTTSGSKT